MADVNTGGHEVSLGALLTWAMTSFNILCPLRTHIRTRKAAKGQTVLGKECQESSASRRMWHPHQYLTCFNNCGCDPRLGHDFPMVSIVVVQGLIAFANMALHSVRYLCSRGLHTMTNLHQNSSLPGLSYVSGPLFSSRLDKLTKAAMQVCLSRDTGRQPMGKHESAFLTPLRPSFLRWFSRVKVFGRLKATR